MSDTKETLETASKLAEMLGSRDLFSASNYAACEVYRDAVRACLIRDLAAAAKRAGAPRPSAPRRHNHQGDWRDYSGWLCSDERSAKFVKSWCEKYTRTSAGGDGREGAYIEQRGNDFFVVTAVYKIGD